ncbi:DUF4249 domain-containing protein [Psychroserpens algicola]|uniref:DUF4249 domain-containing protein n=1 Tax=Psychroserpens algicola TaxID=1719034 RepID=A0ABT0HAL7_9FLAO|nr:DUF4249 domain-containing protein [Psychroserpens algicola]MCK8481074.1 DUF4249 domain-containing protein [Psychroserpens algicola]
MKNALIILLVLCFVSCEDVIDVDLNSTEPKLVIDASINWFKGTSGNEQDITLTLSAPYFDTEVPPATGAQVRVINSSATVFEFTEEGTSGIYKNSSFIPQINETYQLEITYQGETYTATETLKSVVDLDYIEQNDDGGFTGEETELKAFYTDPADEENYYFFEFISDIPEIPSLEVYDDEFTNGNQIFGFYTEEELESGDVVTIRNYGVSQRFYEFMFILLQQNAEEGGGPFETQPATVRGNCINETNAENFPLGYFRLSEVAELIYTVQ